MGLQITVLLADVIYVETLQSTVPVFDSLGSGDIIFSVLKSIGKFGDKLMLMKIFGRW